MKDKVLCPECGSEMHVVSPTRHDKWPAFYGCNDYPNCEGSRNIVRGKPESDESARQRRQAEMDYAAAAFDDIHYRD